MTRLNRKIQNKIQVNSIIQKSLRRNGNTGQDFAPLVRKTGGLDSVPAPNPAAWPCCSSSVLICRLTLVVVTKKRGCCKIASLQNVENRRIHRTNRVENSKADFKNKYSKAEHPCKKQVLSFLHFQFRKTLLFFEWKKMRVSLSALQFGKELLEVKGETEKKEFC